MTSDTKPASSPEATSPKSTPATLKKQQNNPDPVRWAPVRGIPIERRLQMTAVCVWISLVLVCLMTFIFLATYKFLWPLLIAYISFLYVDKAPEAGGRRFESTRNWTIWNYFAAYFPVKLIKVVLFFIFVFINYCARERLI